MLVDTASQYGVGSLYFLAGWFQLAPIGYGTLGFLDGGPVRALLRRRPTACCGSRALPRCLRRGAGARGDRADLQPRVLGRQPAAARAAAVRASHGGDPRCGSPGPLARTRAHRARLRSSSWSPSPRCGPSKPSPTPPQRSGRSHAFGPGRSQGRGAWLGWCEPAAVAAAACVVAHVLLAVATLAFAGQLPDWGQYLAYLNEFLFGQVGDITYDFSDWSAGLPDRRRVPGLRGRLRPCGSAPPRPRRQRAGRPGRALRSDRLRHRAVQLLREPVRGPHPALRLASGPDGGHPVAEPAAAGRPGRIPRPASWRAGVRPVARGPAGLRRLVVDRTAGPADGAGSRRSRRRIAAARRSTASGTRRRSTPGRPRARRSLNRYMPGDESAFRSSRRRIWRPRSCSAAGARTGSA